MTWVLIEDRCSGINDQATLLPFWQHHLLSFGLWLPVGRPFSIYKDLLDDFILLSEDELYEGIALAAHHTRNLSEGAGAVCLRAAIKVMDQLEGKTVAIQMSGGNASSPELKETMKCKCLESGDPDIAILQV